jgi:hypothetical protein
MPVVDMTALALASADGVDGRAPLAGGAATVVDVAGGTDVDVDVGATDVATAA